MITPKFNKMHFGLYDKKGNLFVDYLWSTSFADVSRHFHFLVNQQNTILNLYARDFCVYLLGSIDDSTGEYAPCENVVIHECADLFELPGESEVEDELSY